MPSVDTASAILASLDALGLTHVLYCPGSRSAPFAYALEAGAFSGDARAVLDERGAGFMAVGLARTGALPAIVVTSGTAVAELAPAVLEASHARLPPTDPGNCNAWGRPRRPTSRGSSAPTCARRWTWNLRRPRRRSSDT